MHRTSTFWNSIDVPDTVLCAEASRREWQCPQSWDGRSRRSEPAPGCAGLPGLLCPAQPWSVEPAGGAPPLNRSAPPPWLFGPLRGLSPGCSPSCPWPPRGSGSPLHSWHRGGVSPSHSLAEPVVSFLPQHPLAAGSWGLKADGGSGLLLFVLGCGPASWAEMEMVTLWKPLS